jgi:hypothetical protein
MDLSQQKEQFSNAYLCAVAAAAGFQSYKPLPDVDKTDWVIAAPGPKGTVRSPKVEVQLKCTSRDVLRDDHLTFSIDVETYDDLRDPSHMIPRILAVVIVPEDVREWLAHSEERLELRHCGYWASLREQPETDNSTSVTVHIPRSQQFTVESLTEILERIGAGKTP